MARAKGTHIGTTPLPVCQAESKTALADDWDACDYALAHHVVVRPGNARLKKWKWAAKGIGAGIGGILCLMMVAGPGLADIKLTTSAPSYHYLSERAQAMQESFNAAFPFRTQSSSTPARIASAPPGSVAVATAATHLTAIVF